ncbi:hypothetical protein CCR75_007400 [Bremia lactucae]|uniref:Uncharacterized protein n=1 Tax=Bremia lactucae TaxID=4779 RepID=A0A976ILS4_BRELC|nr:hypothetical protein CCR75_007400 [Bremia lactucae]
MGCAQSTTAKDPTDTIPVKVKPDAACIETETVEVLTPDTAVINNSKPVVEDEAITREHIAESTAKKLMKEEDKDQKTSADLPSVKELEAERPMVDKKSNETIGKDDLSFTTEDARDQEVTGAKIITDDPRVGVSF